MIRYSLNECQMINLPKITSVAGNLTFIESNKHIPFEIKRIYYLYDVPSDSFRGAHAHKKLHQIILPLSGSFDIEINDGRNKKRFHLNRPNIGLYLTPMIWRFLDNFSSGTVCLVLASEVYDEDDYYRNYDDFIHKVESL